MDLPIKPESKSKGLWDIGLNQVAFCFHVYKWTLRRKHVAAKASNVDQQLKNIPKNDDFLHSFIDKKYKLDRVIASVGN